MLCFALADRKIFSDPVNYIIIKIAARRDCLNNHSAEQDLFLLMIGFIQKYRKSKSETINQYGMYLAALSDCPKQSHR
nr:hypothetical protein SYMBAF_20376 [Serratia symbiotica]